MAFFSAICKIRKQVLAIHCAIYRCTDCVTFWGDCLSRDCGFVLCVFFLIYARHVVGPPLALSSGLVNQQSVILTYCLRSVLPPPPPRYSVPIAYAAGASNGMAVPIIETNNIVSHPEGGCPLQVGEGMPERLHH